MNLENCLKALPKGQVNPLDNSSPVMFKPKETTELSLRLSENLENISRSKLIDKIREYERKETHLITHINDLNDVINEENRDIRRSDDLNEHVTTGFKLKIERLNRKFDELFNVRSSKN